MPEQPKDGTPNEGTVELTETQLSEVDGGLLPAVQKVRFLASTSSVVDVGDDIAAGSTKPRGGGVGGAGL